MTYFPAYNLNGTIVLDTSLYNWNNSVLKSVPSFSATKFPILESK